MTKTKFNLRNVVAIAICLTVTTSIFFSCGKEKFGNKQIIAFNFTEPAIDVRIDEEMKYIYALVPKGTCLEELVPIITVSDGATVSPLDYAPQDFTGSDKNPVIYTVTAKNGSKATYKVIVFVSHEGKGTISIDGNLMGTYNGATYANNILTLHAGYYAGFSHGDNFKWTNIDQSFSINTIPNIPFFRTGSYETGVLVQNGGTLVYGANNKIGVTIVEGVASLVDCSCDHTITISGMVGAFPPEDPPKPHTLSVTYEGPVWCPGQPLTLNP